MKYLFILLLTAIAFSSVKVGGRVPPYKQIFSSGYSDSTTKKAVYKYKTIANKTLETETVYEEAEIPVYQQYKGYTSTNVLICYRANDTESLKSANLANNLWGGNCYLLEIDNTHMDTQSDHWGTATHDYFDCFNNLTDFQNDWVTPLTNYIKNKNIKYIANAYRMPYKINTSHSSIIYQFYTLSGISLPTTNNSSPLMFSFGCRTFEDTSNLLYYTSVFNPFITNGYLVQDDCQNDWHGSFPAGNYLSSIDYNKIYDSSNTYTTKAPNKINYLLHNGYWMGARDDHLRNTTKFETYPNSVVMSIESYNFSSYRKGSIRYHQNRLFDAFDQNCNDGNYDRIFGCAIGHTHEPGWLRWNVENFWRMAIDSYSYLECFYNAHYSGFDSSSHIVIGNPFLRLKP